MVKLISRMVVMTVLLALTVTYCSAVAAESESAVVKNLFFNVKDFGAKGDGEADDSDALQKAIDTACLKDDMPARNAIRKVVLPPGIYRITKSIKLNTAHWNLVMEGTGGAQGGTQPSFNGIQRANTVLRWDGDNNGFLLDTYGLMGLRLKDMAFDGQNKCATLLRMNSLDKDNKDKTLIKKYGSRGAANWLIEGVLFENAGTGVECGGDSWTCASDMTLIDVCFSKCKAGFATLMDQNLNYNFIRPTVSQCDIGLHFKRGGNVTTIMLGGYACGYAIKIDKGGINAGTFNFIGTRVETRIYNNKRTAILYAEGESNINFTSLVTTCMGLSRATDKISVEFGNKPDYETTLFTIRNGAMVKVSSSLISGPIADLQGKSWLQLDNCRFRYLADPEKDITCDKTSGFEVSNSFLTKDRIDQGKYVIDRQVFINKIIKLPEMDVIGNK